MTNRCRFLVFSGLLFLGALAPGCRPTTPPAPCVTSTPRARPEGWKCGSAGPSTECYDGSPCTSDICGTDGACSNPVLTGDCDAGAGWHGVCDASGACCPRSSAPAVEVTVRLVPASASAAPVTPPR